MIYAIADLHLSLLKPKPMSVFSKEWKNHEIKIRKNWESLVTDKDTVIIAGDISWAMRTNDALLDLELIHKLPGKKILLPGNHDYWWNSTASLPVQFPTLSFLKRNFYEAEGIGICGGKGWICPNDTHFTEHDEKIYMREINRVEQSIKMAISNGHDKLLLALHYPPTNDKKEDSGFLKLIRKYEIKRVVYGHLHGKSLFNTSLSGMHEGCEYSLVSADSVDFTPLKVF